MEMTTHWFQMVLDNRYVQISIGHRYDEFTLGVIPHDDEVLVLEAEVLQRC